MPSGAPPRCPTCGLAPGQRLVPLREVARALGVTPRAVYKQLKRHQISHFRHRPGHRAPIIAVLWESDAMRLLALSLKIGVKRNRASGKSVG
jgi:hypothetical protein